MRAFLRVFVNHPIAVFLVVAVMSLAGIYASLHMPVDLLPHLEMPVVNIITHYPGAGPEDIEVLVSRPIEDEMRSIPGVKRVASTSIQGISHVTAEFSWGTTVRDARQFVQTRLARIAGILPAGAIPRLENIGATLQEVCGYVIYGGGDPISLLNTIRNDLAGSLMRVEGVSTVDVIGGNRRAFYVKVTPETLVRLHISLDHIVSVLKTHNLTAVTGTLEESGRDYVIRADGRLKTLDDIRCLPVAGHGERSVPLGSVADIYEGRMPKRCVVHGDGVPAVALIVRKQPGANAVRVVQDVARAMSGLSGLLPQGTCVKRFYDQSEIIKEARDEILRDLVIGALLAVLVLYFFLGSLGPTLIVAVTIPITLLATMAVMQCFGLSLNVFTMTALALALGMIVDDVIVVTENIFRHRLITPEPIEASIAGTLEISGADASGTLTTVAAFLPLILVNGIVALFARPFGLTIGSALLISLILSLTLTPMLFGRTGSRIAERKNFAGARVLNMLGRRLQSALNFCLRHGKLTLSMALVCFCMAGLSAFSTKASILPPIDEGAMLIEYVMPPGTSLKESNRMANALERIALADTDVSCIYRRTGSPESGYQVEGVNRGELLIKLRAKNERTRSISEITAGLKRQYSEFPGIVFLYHQPTQEKIDESFSGLPALFGVTIYGAEMDRLIALAGRVETVLSRDPAITNVVNNTKVKVPLIQVRINYPRLNRYGVHAASVLATLQAARFGVNATHIIRQKEEVSVLVILDAGKPLNIEGIRQLPVSGGGGWIPLGRLADISVNYAPSAVSRLNGRREVTILAEVEGAIPRVVKRLREKFRSIRLPEGYTIDFTGQYNVLIRMATDMVFIVSAAVFLIFLIMAMQFGSWIQPLIILLTIPMSLAGALIALVVTRQGINISVGMGALTLVGIAVNNAIVLIDYANRRVDAGDEIREALRTAASVRLRPILLTTFTTISALIPAAIGTTVGSQIFQPFAITVIGGLISGVISTLLIVPTLTDVVIRRRV